LTLAFHNTQVTTCGIMLLLGAFGKIVKKIVEDSKRIVGLYHRLTHDQLIVLIDAAIETVPVQLQKSISFLITDDDPTGMYMEFQRPETDKEEKVRLSAEEKRANEKKQTQISKEKRDRATYERLKKRFGEKNDI
jgi:hypothetical protein